VAAPPEPVQWRCLQLNKRQKAKLCDFSSLKF
jgi:hypothetical protein